MSFVSESEMHEFRPELISRRGEWTAWGLASVAVLSVWILSRSGYVPSWACIFLVFLVFSGISISLGNWLDRNTVIRLGMDGISFENGLRRVWMQWFEVQKVAVMPSRWGKSVQVVGEKSHFNFKTLGEVQFQGEVRGRTGFADGQKILDILLRETGLELIEESNNAYYYARG